MTIITNIRKLQNAGVLAERTTKSNSLQFHRYNLIYGYNGSGKSTLSRMFACFQAGSVDDRLPPDCIFEFQLSDGTVLAQLDKLGGIQNRLLVFNSDFIERNLQWSEAHANPVFYIGQEQADAAATLAKTKTAFDAAQVSYMVAGMETKAADKELASLKRGFAKEVAAKLRLRGRKYEANHWADDYEALSIEQDSVLSAEKLKTVEATCQLEEPMPKLQPSAALYELDLSGLIRRTRTIAQRTFSTTAMSEFEEHPLMVKWVKDGHDYHSKEGLQRCLYCGSLISAERQGILNRALDDSLNKYLETIEELGQAISSGLNGLRKIADDLHPAEATSAELRPNYRAALAEYLAAQKEANAILARCASIATDKRAKPTLAIDISALPDDEELTRVAIRLSTSLGKINELINMHNAQFDDFSDRQNKARLSLRKHFLAINADEYRKALDNAATSKLKEGTAQEATARLASEIAELEMKIRQHGPAAEKINQLIRAYLGHNELSIAPVEEGYQIQRHGLPIDGLPSEGEKTAIAISYFLSMLDADGRKLEHLIVVLDDPISSLDTKALNFASSLLRSRLEAAEQLFVLTHNHNFMNEFRKNWKNKQNPKDGKEQTASFFFLDVAMSKAAGGRVSTIVELPRLLREYDSEYHFLFHYILEFEAKGSDYEYAYLLPNVLRRVLDVFLAFRCPGTAGLAPKVVQLCKRHDQLDSTRMSALERLTQVESHSDSIDDLISFSSMTLEETAEATKTLIEMMEIVDPDHLKGLRHLCRP